MGGVDRRARRWGSAREGFTLLEVMIAVAVIAIAMVTLIGSQSQSVAIATGARFDTTASMLAQQKLVMLSMESFADLADGEGRFEEEWSGYRWELAVEELSEEEVGIKGVRGLLKVVDLRVFLEEDRKEAFTVRTIVLNRIEPRG